MNGTCERLIFIRRSRVLILPCGLQSVLPSLDILMTQGEETSMKRNCFWKLLATYIAMLSCMDFGCSLPLKPFRTIITGALMVVTFLPLARFAEDLLALLYLSRAFY